MYMTSERTLNIYFPKIKAAKAKTLNFFFTFQTFWGASFLDVSRFFSFWEVYTWKVSIFKNLNFSSATFRHSKGFLIVNFWIQKIGTLNKSFNFSQIVNWESCTLKLLIFFIENIKVLTFSIYILLTASFQQCFGNILDKFQTKFLKSSKNFLLLKNVNIDQIIDKQETF